MKEGKLIYSHQHEIPTADEIIAMLAEEKEKGCEFEDDTEEEIEAQWQAIQHRVNDVVAVPNPVLMEKGKEFIALAKSVVEYWDVDMEIWERKDHIEVKFPMECSVYGPGHLSTLAKLFQASDELVMDKYHCVNGGVMCSLRYCTHDLFLDGEQVSFS